MKQPTLDELGLPPELAGLLFKYREAGRWVRKCRQAHAEARKDFSEGGPARWREAYLLLSGAEQDAWEALEPVSQALYKWAQMDGES